MKKIKSNVPFEHTYSTGDMRIDAALACNVITQDEYNFLLRSEYKYVVPGKRTLFASVSGVIYSEFLRGK